VPLLGHRGPGHESPRAAHARVGPRRAGLGPRVRSGQAARPRRHAYRTRHSPPAAGRPRRRGRSRSLRVLDGRGSGDAGSPRGPLVAEACESDGTLVGYRPRIGVILNVSRDHDELEALRRQFTTFAERCETLLVNAASAEARAIGAPLGARTFGSTSDADFR